MFLTTAKYSLLVERIMLLKDMKFSLIAKRSKDWLNQWQFISVGDSRKVFAYALILKCPALECKFW